MNRAIVWGIALVSSIGGYLIYDNSRDNRDREAARHHHDASLEREIRAKVDDKYDRMHIDLIQNDIRTLEEDVKRSSSPGDIALAVEKLREAKEELKKYQDSLVSRHR